jgi:hypothetical protein
MISLIITIVVLGLICGLLLWAVDYIGIIPEPFKKVAKAIIILVIVVYLLGILLPMLNGSLPALR